MNDVNNIKAAFLQFYLNLNKERQTKDIEIEKYLSQQCETELTEEHKGLLNKERSQEEIREAIDLMKTGKAPGPDGFTAEFYKIFKEDLVQGFQLVANSSLNGEKPPETWQEALLSLLYFLKMNQDVQMLKTLGQFLC